MSQTEKYERRGWPYTKRLTDGIVISVQSLFPIGSGYRAVVQLGSFTRSIQIATSDGEDWCTFIIRVLDILAIYDNDIIRSYIAVNRATLLYEAGVTYDGSRPVAPCAGQYIEMRVPYSDPKYGGDAYYVCGNVMCTQCRM
jgi:hypothetical protein